jgi:hypothetical protein
MAITDDINEVLHHVRVKLYPNYLSSIEGAYIARTNNEASLTIEEVCAALKNRGGFTGSYGDLVECVHQFFHEAAYQLCDGFAVNTGYYSIHPNVGGTFDKIIEGHDGKKHPITFRFRARAPLRALAEHIVVEVEGLANVNGYIGELEDVGSGAVNETLTPGDMFHISGHKIKIFGTDSEVGIYFVSTDKAGLRVKVSGRLAENTATNLIGIIPALDAGVWKVEIKTQYAGSGDTALKAPRIIESAFTLTTAAVGS